MDKDYNRRQVFDLSRKAHIFAGSVIYVESTCIPRKCNFLLILLLEWKWKQLQGKILLRRVNWQKRYTNCKWRMTNFNILLLSSQQREAKQKCTLCYLYAFFWNHWIWVYWGGKKGEKSKWKNFVSSIPAFSHNSI